MQTHGVPENSVGLKNSQNTAKGRHFENQVRKVLEEANDISRGLITFKSTPKLRLQNGEVLKPDFSVKIERPHEARHFLIECQNRSRSTKDILYKMQHIRAKHRSKTFFFIYANRIGVELARTFRNEGVASRNLEEFRAYIHDEAVVTCLSWSVRSPALERPVQMNSEEMELPSKSQISLNSHPDANATLDEPPGGENSNAGAESANKGTGIAFG